MEYNKKKYHKTVLAFHSNAPIRHQHRYCDGVGGMIWHYMGREGEFKQAASKSLQSYMWKRL